MPGIGLEVCESDRLPVHGRLGTRRPAFPVGSFGEYCALLGSGDRAGEARAAVDLPATDANLLFGGPEHGVSGLEPPPFGKRP